MSLNISQIEDYGNKFGTENFDPKVNKIIEENNIIIIKKINNVTEINTILMTGNFSIEKLKIKIESGDYKTNDIYILENQINKLKDLGVNIKNINISNEYIKKKRIHAILETDTYSVKKLKFEIDSGNYTANDINLLKNKINKLKDLGFDSEYINTLKQYIKKKSTSTILEADTFL